jgi:hypothetical protein
VLGNLFKNRYILPNYKPLRLWAITRAFPFSAIRRAPFWLMTCGVLAACDPIALVPNAAPPEPGVVKATRDGPKGAELGTCWGKTISPAVIETFSEQVQIKPAKVNSDGTIGRLPVYRTESHQLIVTPRRDNWFETPCAEALTQEFNGSLQRALQARGFYKGKITGESNRRTRAAVLAFQKTLDGPSSEVLSLDAARALGLISIERAEDT